MKTIENGEGFPIQPDDIPLPLPPETFRDYGLDSAEMAEVATYMIRICQKKGGWAPFDRQEIEVEAGNRDVHLGRLTTDWLIDYSQSPTFRVTEEFVTMCHRSSKAT